MRDASQKGRLCRPRVYRLSPAQRQAIYAMPERRGLVVELAARYGVTPSRISKIRRGRFVGAVVN